MTALNVREIGWLSSELAAELCGGHVRELVDDGARTLYVTFRQPRRNLVLLLALEPGWCRLHLLPERPPAPQAPTMTPLL